MKRTTLMTGGAVLLVAGSLALASPASAAHTVHSTNLEQNGWYFTNDFRSDGRSEYVDGGMRLWTVSSTSQAKATMYRQVDRVPLVEFDEPTVTFGSASGGKPGMQVALDVDGDGDWDGHLVGEPWSYGAGTWWTSKNFGLPSGGGYEDMGTIAEFAAQNPNAKVIEFGLSLGSGVQGDATVTGLTANGTTYTFDFVKPLPELPAGYPVVETVAAVEVLDCEAPLGSNVEIHTTFSTTDLVLDEDRWEFVEGELVLTTEVTTRAATAEELENCAVDVDPVDESPVTPPVDETPSTPADETPSKPAAEKADELAKTGADALWPAIGALGTMLLGGALIAARRLVRQ